MIDCEKLTGRMKAICDGTSGLPPETEEAYRKLWEGQPAPTKTDPFACVHRGGHIGWVPCPTCIPEKNVQMKLYACPLHANCVLRMEDLGKIKGCGGCGSRTESRLEPAESA